MTCFVPERELDHKALFPAGTLGSLCGQCVYIHMGAKKLLPLLQCLRRFEIKHSSGSHVLDPSAALCPQAV